MNRPLRRCIPWFCALLSAAPPATQGSPSLPPPVLPQGVGVNIHFTRGHARDLDMIAAGGFKFIRMDFSWGGTERRRGAYDWSAYDELTANLDRRGLRAIYILDYSNGLYEETVVSRNPITGREQRDTASPAKPESVAAFARWAGAAAAHFKGRGILWEIWNEPNIGFWKPKPDVGHYVALARATCRAVRAADPEALVLAPASSEFPWPFLEALLKSDVPASLDAISVHPYRGYHRGPETAGGDYRRLRGLIEQHAPPDRWNLPIVSGEWGYATHARGGVSPDVQAAFLARQQLANLYHGVPLSIWYDWKNDGLDPHEREHNFGTVTASLEPKPAYRAAQVLARELGGYRIARRLDTGDADEYALLLVNAAGSQKLAAWSAGQPRQVTLDLNAPDPSTVTAVSGQGDPVPLQAGNTPLALPLRAAPLYITFHRPLEALSAAAAWQAGPVRSLVEAGRPDALRVPVVASNPLPVRLALNLQWNVVGASLAGSGSLLLRPGETRTEVFKATPMRRWPPTLTVTLKVAAAREEAPGRRVPLGISGETFEFTLANPLRLQVAPVSSGLQLDIRNPSGTVFEGSVHADAAAQPVRLSQGEFGAVVLLKEAPGARLVQLRDARGGVVAETRVPTFHPLAASRLRAALDGDAQVPACASLARTNAPGDGPRPFPEAWELAYAFEAGWRFVRVVAEDAPRLPLGSRPQAVGMWVYGDRSGNALRLRVTDAAGQTFQPSGPPLDWAGWRWVEFDLADLKAAGHWGGANDGVARGVLRLDTWLLVDGTRGKTAGRIWFAGPASVRHDTP
ncbi:MAG: cellulase family glycosylhydrolase [Verrucomicrobia bacterium]|nr:cellulase family glycosylhydrolase [Verrucomicrobiota bacterium]